MEIDASLMEIFLNEAQSYLTILEDPQSDLKAKADAAHGMKGIAAMLEFSELSQEASVLEHQLRAADDSEMGSRVAQLRAQLEEIQTRAEKQFSKEDEPQSQPEPPQRPKAKTARQQLFSDDSLEAIDEAIDESPVPAKGAEPAPDEGPEDEVEDPEWDPETTQMLQSIFLEEAGEILDGIDKTLAGLAKDINNADHVHSLFRLTHTLKGAAGTVGFGWVSKAAHAMENHFDAIRSGRAEMSRERLDTLVSAADILHNMVEQSADADSQKSLFNQLKQELTQSSSERPDRPAEKAGVHPDPSETPAPVADEPPEELDPMAAEQAPEQAKEPFVPAGDRRAAHRRMAERREDDKRIIRLPVERVDRLMEAVGELIFSRTRFQRKNEEIYGLLRDLVQSHRALRSALMGLRVTREGKASHQRLTEVEVEFADEVANLERAVAGLTEDTEELRRVSARIQEDLVRLRMMSISYLMARLRRSARQIAQSQGKKLNVVVEGEDTELDKAVAERLTDPLIHLVRNAVAHGIESPEERTAAGKPETGTVRITAQQEGENVILRVSDNGRGIDLEQVRSSLVHRAMMTRTQVQSLSDDEALEAIFMPGFTTIGSADDVAGRGVGLDVVSESIAMLAGNMQVSTRVGEGTEFFIRLPLLAAISNALLFKVGGQVYGLSVSHVEQTCLFDDDQLEEVTRTSSVTLKGERLRVVNLPALLGVTSQRRGRFQQAVVARWASKRFVFTIDKTVGPREIVVKPLGPLLSPLPLYCGATISGAGKVQLVLDPAGLAKIAGLRPRFERIKAYRPQRVRRILVCDDSRSIREVLSRILMQAGYNVELASDGWDAWERMGAAAVDLLLTDLEMPRLDGYTLIEKVRKHEQFREMPILVLTSRTGEANRERANSAGADIFITKPVNRRTILKHIRDLLKN